MGVAFVSGAAATLVCLVGAARPAWSGDEAATVVILRRSGAEFWRAVGGDPAIGPYYVLLKPMALLSMGHMWLRLPSALAIGLASAVLAVHVHRMLGAGRAAAAVAALLVMPAVSRYGQDARPYALATLAVVTAVWSFWGFLRTGAARWGIGLVCALTFGGLMHAYTLLIAVPLLIVAAAHPGRSGWRDLLRTGLVVVGVGVVLAPYLLLLATRGVGHPDPPPVGLASVAEAVGRLPVALLRPPLAPTTWAAILLAGAAGMVVLLRRDRLPDRGPALLVVTWLVAPPLLMILGQAVLETPGLVARYWTFCLPALAIAVSEALLVGHVRWIAVLSLGAICVVGLPTQLVFRGVDGHQGERWVRLPAALDRQRFAQVPLLIQGYSQRGLSANAPDFPAERTPLNGDPGLSGRISPVPFGPGTPQFEALVAGSHSVFIYQQRKEGGASVPTADDFVQARDARGVFTHVVVLCNWFGDALGLFERNESPTGAAQRAVAARAIESVRPDRVMCEPGH